MTTKAMDIAIQRSQAALDAQNAINVLWASSPGSRHLFEQMSSLIDRMYENERAERFEEAYENHIAAMEPGFDFVEFLYESEEEARKWENENWDKVEAYEEKRLIPKEY